MEDRGLTELLKEMLVVFNREARLTPPKLESEMCLALDRLGGRWLLAGLQSRGVDGTDCVEGTADKIWTIIRTEAGQKHLKEAIAAHRAGMKDMRRKVVGLIRTCIPDDPGIVLREEPPSESADIYGMLLTRQ